MGTPSARHLGLVLATAGALACGSFGAAPDPDAGADSSTTDGPTGSGGPRVTTGLVALYTFREGKGSTVADVSGVVPALDLVIKDKGASMWGKDGLELSGTHVRSMANATKITTACKAANQLSVEAWVKPTTASQTGPARVVSIADDTSGANRTFLLGIGKNSNAVFGTNYVFRLASAGGGHELEAPETSVAKMQHVVVTAAAPGVARMYVDGTEYPGFDLPGDFAHFNDHHLSLGDEIVQDTDGKPRNFNGTYALVALYCKELSKAEVETNRAAGPPR